MSTTFDALTFVDGNVTSLSKGFCNGKNYKESAEKMIWYWNKQKWQVKTYA